MNEVSGSKMVEDPAHFFRLSFIIGRQEKRQLLSKSDVKRIGSVSVWQRRKN